MHRHFIQWPAFSLLLCCATYVSAQSTTPTQNPAQSGQSASPSNQTPTTPHNNAAPSDRDQDRDINREELARFDQFLDSHREIADQLRKDPALVNDPQYLKDHPALQTYLQDHSATRTALQNDPNAFMSAEDRYEHREDRSGDFDRDRDRERRQLANFDQFLDSHREIGEQVRKDPPLADNQQFLKNHPALQTYLQDHPEVRQQLQQDPNAFMHQEDRYDSREDAMNRNNSDRDRRELSSFNQFLDSHRETAEQLRKNPSLADNQQFLKDHPALQTYLQDHPEVRQQLQQDPNSFMRQEDRYDRREDARNRGGDFSRGYGYDRDRNGDHGAQRRFGEFLGSHSDINEQLSKNPSLCKSEQYMQDHPELQSYLNSNPDVRQQLMADPDNFVKSTQQLNNTQSIKGTGTTQPTGTTPSSSPTSAPKPKQQ